MKTEVNGAVKSKESLISNSVSPKINLNIPGIASDQKESITTNRSMVSRRKDGRKQINQYILVKMIGQGQYAKVYACFEEKDPNKKMYAMKVLKKQNKRTGYFKKKTQNTFIDSEMAILKKMNHPNVLNLKELIDDQTQNKVYVITDLANESLAEKINRKGKFKMEDCLKYFRQIILALEYCHECAGVIHRDIKPENILLDDNDDVKLADFGVSSIMENGCDELSNTAGSNFYMSPEACKGSMYKGRGSDVWAAGITLFFMVMGELPFLANNYPDLFQKIQNEEPEFPNWLEPNTKDLLQKILEKDPEKRI
mmetsp:Transcript_21796/g.20927  ORF Transcript_21796/g.20927 Transcript_21796/m.20927 type:complete len:311 (+) Transcript_21796:2396-3328(+)